MKDVGIDVGARELQLCDSDSGQVRRFSNDAAGHRKVLKALGSSARVCLESTGIYHFDLAVALNEAKGVEVMVINPRAARHFAQALMQRGKDDPLDARCLREYCRRMEFQAWQQPESNRLRLRAFSRRIAQLNKAKTQAKNQLHAFTSSAHTPPELLDDVRLSVHQYEQQIDALRDHACRLIDSDVRLARAFELLCSVPGIAQASAIQLLGELLVLPTEMSAPQWVAHAGLDPRHERSGSSLNKPPRISKAGNAYLRHATYMPALVATRASPQVRAYYQQLLKRRGFKKIQGVCAVMRKLLHAIHGMLRTDTPFDGHRFFAGPLDQAEAARPVTPPVELAKTA